MNAKVTPMTGQALRKVFALLEDHFDAEKGQYRNSYDDARIAKETGISVQAVKEYRTSAFGKLQAPTELHKAKMDLEALETAYLKMDAEMRQSIKDLKQRVLILQRRFD